jgi:hypothetical protein
MNIEQLTQEVAGLKNLGEEMLALSLTQAGQLMAVMTTTQALIVSVAKMFPSLLEPLEDNLRGLASFQAEELSERSVEKFRSSIATMFDVISSLK